MRGEVKVTRTSQLGRSVWRLGPSAPQQQDRGNAGQAFLHAHRMGKAYSMGFKSPAALAKEIYQHITASEMVNGNQPDYTSESP